MAKPAPELLLPDVNVLVALAYAHHPHHFSVVRFMEGCQHWATCAMTQLGFLRVSLTPAFTNVEIPPQEAWEILRELTSDPGHRYLGEAPSPLEVEEAFRHVRGHRQVTDAYLIRFAAHHGARLVTLDAKLRSLPGVLVLGSHRARD